MKRNAEIEQRIQKRKYNDMRLNINSYGGMGMDGISANEKTLRLEEMNYIANHPEIYKPPSQPMTPFSLTATSESDTYAPF